MAEWDSQSSFLYRNINLNNHTHEDTFTRGKHIVQKSQNLMIRIGRLTEANRMSFTSSVWPRPQIQAAQHGDR